MTPPRPRWEWRTFANGFGDIERRIREQSDPPRETSEIYIVSDRADANTKIRYGQIDVKVLQRTEPRGLELWQPTFKSGFPLPMESIRLLFREWGVPAPAVIPDAPSMYVFIKDIVKLHVELKAVAVDKKRQGCVIDDCLVEVADLAFDGEPARTIAVEHVDPERLWNLVEALGLSEFENVNYVKAIKRFVLAHGH